MSVFPKPISRTRYDISIAVIGVTRDLVLDKARIINYLQGIISLLRIKAYQKESFVSLCFQEERIGTHLCQK